LNVSQCNKWYAGALQVIGLGWKNYWKVMWNKFDCILLVTGIVDMVLTIAIGRWCVAQC
jgi:hypothetical protein